MKTALAWLLVLGLQDGAGIKELLDRLGDDSIDVRAEAVEKLVKEGKEALPVLRKAVESAGGEVKERILEVIRKIEKKERLAALLPPPTRVTLEAKEKSLRAVFEELQKQGPTPIDFAKVPEGEKVSVSLSGTPFWEALDALCRSSDKVMYQVAGDKVVILNEPYASRPRRVRGPLLMAVQEIRMTQYSTIGGAGSESQFTAMIQVCWEKGTKPDGVLVESADIRDEQGGDLPDFYEIRGNFGLQRGSCSEGMISHSMSFMSQKIPSWDALKLSRFKIEVACEFVLEYEGVTFKDPMTKAGASEVVNGVTVTLQGCSRSGSDVVVDVEFAGGDDAARDKLSQAMRLLDTEGKPLSHNRDSRTGGDGCYRCTLCYPIAEKVEVGSFEIKVPKEVHAERLMLDLKDLPLE